MCMAAGRECGGGTAAGSPSTDGHIRIYPCQDPVDFRAGINELAALVEATLKYDPFSRNLFCFTNKRKNSAADSAYGRSGWRRSASKFAVCQAQAKDGRS